MAEDDDRYLFHPEFLSGKSPGMPCEDVVVGTHEDRVGPPPLANRSRNVGDLFAAVGSRVVGPGNQPFDGPAFNLDVEVRGVGFGRALCH